MKIYFTTWLQEASQADALTKQGAKHRLLSYYYLKSKYNLREKWRIERLRELENLPKEELQEFIQIGTFTDIRRQRIMEKNKDSKIDQLDTLADTSSTYKEVEKIIEIQELRIKCTET